MRIIYLLAVTAVLLAQVPASARAQDLLSRPPVLEPVVVEAAPFGWLLLDARGEASIHLVLQDESAATQPDLLKNRIVPIFMGLVGIGMVGIWTADIVGGRFADQGNFFGWREGENLLWPHILAEQLTAAGLIAGGVGLYLDRNWSLPVALISLGSLSYSVINSSGWVLAERERLSYGIPMWIAFSGGVVSIAILVR